MKRIVRIALVFLLLLSMTACGGQAAERESGGAASAEEALSKKEQWAAEGLGWGAVVSFGSYEQDNDPGNGKEPIEWLVLDVEEGRALLLSRKILDAALFDESGEIVHWDECTLRTWLDQTFLSEAFSETEQESVLLSHLDTPANSVYDTHTVQSTEDRVFLLSLEEVEQYFALSWGTSGHFYDNDIKAEATAYALSKGLEEEQQRADWCLRSSGFYGGSGCACVHASGWISSVANLGNREVLWGIRPAVWVDLDAALTIVQKQASDTDTGLTDIFPTDWEGRYVTVADENVLHVYCKMAYDTLEGDMRDQSRLFSVYYLTDDNLTLPESASLGTYDGVSVEMVVRPDVPSFSSDAVTAEYIDMCCDLGSIQNALRDRIAELEHFRRVEQFGFDTSLYTTPDASAIATGIYQLECGDWTEASKTELLTEYNHTSYLSVSPDGTVYLSLGSREPIKGTILGAADPDALPEGEPQAILWFENDRTVKPVSYLQLVMSIHGMEEAELVPDAPKGLLGSEWTYTWVSGEYWTEGSMRGDIG